VEVKRRIAEEAGNLFFKFGVKRVTMDEVCGQLGMSKKTIYQYFKDKNELVSSATHLHLAKEQKDFEDISQNAANAIDELYEVSKCVRQSINDLNPTVLFDLKRFYPVSYKHWLEFKENHVFKSIINNLDRGIADGHFRKDLNAGILANLRLWEIQTLFDTESFPRDKFDFREVQMQLFDHFVFGIVTEKGRKLYTEYLEKEKNGVFV